LGDWVVNFEFLVLNLKLIIQHSKLKFISVFRIQTLPSAPSPADSSAASLTRLNSLYLIVFITYAVYFSLSHQGGGKEKFLKQIYQNSLVL
jgi:hypothetical protein